MYGFEGEVKAKYDVSVMELFTEVFNDLPVAAVINKKVRRSWSLDVTERAVCFRSLLVVAVCDDCW